MKVQPLVSANIVNPRDRGGTFSVTTILIGLKILITPARIGRWITHVRLVVWCHRCARHATPHREVQEIYTYVDNLQNNPAHAFDTTTTYS